MEILILAILTRICDTHWILTEAFSKKSSYSTSSVPLPEISPPIENKNSSVVTSLESVELRFSTSTVETKLPPNGESSDNLKMVTQLEVFI